MCVRSGEGPIGPIGPRGPGRPGAPALPGGPGEPLGPGTPKRERERVCQRVSYGIKNMTSETSPRNNAL